MTILTFVTLRLHLFSLKNFKFPLNRSIIIVIIIFSFISDLKFDLKRQRSDDGGLGMNEISTYHFGAIVITIIVIIDGRQWSIIIHRIRVHEGIID